MPAVRDEVELDLRPRLLEPPRGDRRGAGVVPALDDHSGDSAQLGGVAQQLPFLEPAVGAALAALPTIAYQRAITPEGFEPSMLAYIVAGLLGIMISLFGAYIGERIQMGGASPRRS